MLKTVESLRTDYTYSSENIFKSYIRLLLCKFMIVTDFLHC